MLRNVLEEINKNNGFSKSLISKNLDIPLEMVSDLINQLIRMGYLNEIEGSPNCEVACGSCPYAKSCNINLVKMYKVSDKGNELLEKN
ncbi:MAG TPA: FeoC-like transcriptional regulator [Tissierellaceae bacterium]|nr:FeoC-like transcriptional regulator [Tissierellaceae bacterium]